MALTFSDHRPFACTVGRPSKFDEDIFNAIVERISSGESLREICRSDDKFPDERTVRRWVVDDNPPGVAPRYARARELQCEAWADWLVEESSKSKLGEKTETDENGNVVKVTTGDTVERSRLACDTRKWLLSKLVPKRYGERLTTDTTISASDSLVAFLASISSPSAQSQPQPPHDANRQPDG